MWELLSDFSQVMSAFFSPKDKDMSRRNVTPSLDFHSMSKEELLELQTDFKKAISSSKSGSMIIAVFWALLWGGLLFGVAGPTYGVVIGLLIFFVFYSSKRREYWILFFSFSDHFYKPIRARFLYISTISYLTEFGILGLYTAPFKMLKRSREFAKANDGRKMNERRAVYELNLVNQLLKSPL
jgi:hypothetical protein